MNAKTTEIVGDHKATTGPLYINLSSAALLRTSALTLSSSGCAKPLLVLLLLLLLRMLASFMPRG
jgi:hypothetical protein